MTPQMRLTDAAARFGGTLLNPDCHFDSLSIDSRSINEGDLFVALIGDRFDGHQFTADAANKASGLVVSTANKQLPLPQWVVEDTTVALGQLAQMRSETFAGTLIAITGSTGKTSVKEMTAAILRHCGAVHATAGNLNNHIGVPLTILSMAEETEYAVIEMGASAGGEIGYLCSVAAPDIALINNVQSSHIEGFGSVEAVAAAKGEIYRGLKPAGIAVLNLDQPWGDMWRSLIDNKPCLTFSATNSAADISAADCQLMDDGCYSFVLCVKLLADQPALKQAIKLSIPGRHAVNNAVAAASCALAAGASLAHIAAGLASVSPIAGRLEFKPIVGGGTVIDDSYNASPSSFEAAIDVLANCAGRKILVMGDMGELGEDSAQMHRQVGDYAAQADVDALYTVGELSAAAAESFGAEHYSSQDRLIDVLFKELQLAQSNNSDITFLVKGSRSSGMEKVVDRLVNGGDR
ncbi:MAG: UDP-N-acetylmuramoyl-tripeptide--D-alanyl-D-alanine ligase [Porticoccaceae bacterium]